MKDKDPDTASHVRRISQERSAALARETLQQSDAAEAYVHKTWPRLQRSMRDLFLGGCTDPKVPAPKDNRYFLYISDKEDSARVTAELKKARQAALRKIRAGGATMPEGGLPAIEVRRLPPKEQWSDIPLEEHGLLYLPNPYIVPGIRYNEMYNWDSMFVAQGLIESNKFDTAKQIVDNLLYEVDHYGTALNGNRTYYLNSGKSRSQPPLVASGILAVFDHWNQLKHAKGESATAWLAHAAEMMEQYSRHWETPPHLHEASGLSRYASGKATPSAEVSFGEPGHYNGALQMLTGMYHRQQAIGEGKEISYQDRKDRYYLEQYLTVTNGGKTFSLSPQFYQGDDAMRESGFDPSRRFDIYNVDVVNHLPVCLNSLRFKMEQDMVGIYDRLAQCDAKGSKQWKTKKQHWEAKAEATRTQINEWLWDSGQDAQGQAERAPCYRDRNINTELCRKYDIPEFRDYNFAASLFPLWVGAASQQQADQTIAHLIPKLKTSSGLNTSDRETGCQWDKPLIWAPLQVMAVEALERYGHHEEALEIATGFLNTVSKDFGLTGKLWEKYESVTGSSNIAEHINKGYLVNDEGFGWTNAAVIQLRHAVRRLQQKIEHGTHGVEGSSPITGQILHRRARDGGDNGQRQIV